MKQQDGTTRMLLAAGLLLTSVSGLVREYVPDFFRGFLVGLGLGLMIFALVRMRKIRRGAKTI